MSINIFIVPYKYSQNKHFEAKFTFDSNKKTNIFQNRLTYRYVQFDITDGESSISPYGELSIQNPVYDSDTDSYAIVFKIEKPVGPAKGIKLIQYDITLLENQAIIIPLK